MSERTLGEILGEGLAASAPVHPIALAGSGDLEAQRLLASQAMTAAREREGLPALVSYMEALTFAQLAASHNAERADLVSVVFLLDEISAQCRRMGDVTLGNGFEAQAVLTAELMAEEGDDEMADMVVACSAGISPEVHIEARRLRELMKQ